MKRLPHIGQRNASVGTPCGHGTPWERAGEASEAGSALLVTLVVITIVTILIGIALATELVQFRSIRQDVHHVRARYLAEAGIYAAMDELQQRPFWQVRDSLFTFAEGMQSLVTVEPFGGYVFIRSIAESGQSRFTTRALVGEVPTSTFSYAVALFDEGTQSGLSLNKDARITGDIALLAEGRGLDTLSTIDGIGFEGDLEGRAYTFETFDVPFHSHLLVQAVALNEAYLAQPSTDPVTLPPELEYTRRTLAWYLPSDLPTVASQSRYTVADSLQFRSPVRVVTEGPLSLEGPLHIEENSWFISGDTLRIGPEVALRQGYFYGRRGIIIEGNAGLSGQFVSQGGVMVQGGSRIGYPSLVYSTGEARGSRIWIKDASVVDGTLLQTAIDPEPVVPAGRVVIDTLALVRGAVYNRHETELHGTLHGSLITHQTYFYYTSPITPGTHYVNWLRDATVDVMSRPITYRTPLGFSPTPELDIIAWEGYAQSLFPEDPAL